ncbi:hypothetical protein G4D82_13225 [Flavobacterium sp. CYK-4]|uniref:hypothetical protein n=1 Tax=Flavobacterium lotistagni TaxID=2709660 RepID=UPI00140777C3|nr:hypothetical protein [Flavobacterium lotistagni]NHM08186.1 hypothetical protein [Flavobacterium lotistagni]
MHNKPFLIIAWGLAIGLGLTGLGFLLHWLLPAIGAMIGIATAIGTGKALSPDFNSWIIPLAAVGLALGGGSGGILLLVKVVKEAEKNLYEWTLPILAIISGFVADTCKEVYSGEHTDLMLRMAYGISVTGLFLLGGILWKQKKVSFKWVDTRMVSVAVFMISPFLIYLKYCEKSQKSLWFGFLDIPTHILCAISILLLFSLLVGFLSWVFAEEQF